MLCFVNWNCRIIEWKNHYLYAYIYQYWYMHNINTGIGLPLIHMFRNWTVCSSWLKWLPCLILYVYHLNNIRVYIVSAGNFQLHLKFKRTILSPWTIWVVIFKDNSTFYHHSWQDYSQRTVVPVTKKKWTTVISAWHMVMWD